MALEQELEEKLLNSFKNIGVKNKTLAVAVSGGVDSTALLLISKIWAEKHNNEIIAITVDHRLRESSSREAQAVANLCGTLGVRHEILVWQHEDEMSNLEANARQERYNLIASFCKKEAIKYLLLAHHLEDQAETFFLRLFRGSGIDGLAAMSRETKLYGLTLLRPFLELHKEDLRQYLLAKNIAWLEDESNEDDKYLRNKIRHFLSSFEDSKILVERINFAVGEIGKCRTMLEEEMLRVEKDVLDFSYFGMIRIIKDNFLRLAEDMQLRILAKVAMKISGNIYKPRLEKLKRLLAEIAENNSLKTTFYGCLFHSYADDIIVFREYNAIGDDVELSFKEEIIWDDRFRIKLTKDIKGLKITHIKKGEFNRVLESVRIFDFKKYKELKQLKAVEKEVLYTLPIVQQGEKYLFDYYYAKIMPL